MKAFLGIILTIGLIKQVYSQGSCSPPCLYDEECLEYNNNSLTTFYCDCNSTLYDDPDFKTLLLTPKLSCKPQQLTIDITGCLGRTLEGHGYELPDDNQQDVPCFNKTYPPEKGVARYIFDFSSANSACVPTISMNDTYVTYSINVLYKYNTSAVEVILYNDITVNYSCSFPLDMNSSLDVGLNPVTSTKNITVIGSGTYSTTMSLFKFPNYTGSYTINDMPIILTIEQPLYIGASVSGADQNKFSLKVVDCYATPTNNSNDTTKYQIITNNCPALGTTGVTFVKNGVALQVEFSIKLFKFVSQPQVYLHCSFALCTGTCIPICGRAGVTPDGSPNVTFSEGPFKLVETSGNSSLGSGATAVVPWAWKVWPLLALLLMKVM